MRTITILKTQTCSASEETRFTRQGPIIMREESIKERIKSIEALSADKTISTMTCNTRWENSQESSMFREALLRSGKF